MKSERPVKPKCPQDIEVLTISQTEYCRMYGVSPVNYDARGIHTESDNCYNACQNQAQNQAFNIGAEVIVGLQHVPYGRTHYLHGTALIPRDRNESVSELISKYEKRFKFSEEKENREKPLKEYIDKTVRKR